jgi:Cu/Ag efflux protein CusF
MKKGAQTYPLVLTLALAAVLAAPAFAQEKPLASQTTISELVSLTGEVVAIDQAGRQVTLRGPLGGEITGRVSDDVKNLAQVKVGDVVVVQYTEALAITLATGGQPGLTSDAAAARAKAGERPAGVVGETTTLTAKVEAIDLEKHTITFKGPEGNTRLVTVKDPKNYDLLKKAKVGDTVNITYTEALAIAVQPAKAN